MLKNLKNSIMDFAYKIELSKTIFFYSCGTSCENACKYVMEFVWRTM
jgi:hypothetical protein